MKRAAILLSLLLATEAAAQSVLAPENFSGIGEQGAQYEPGNVHAPISVVEGPGIKIGEGTVLHPIFGLETGIVSNTFYDDSNPQAAGMLRAVVQVATASLSPQRLQPTEPQTDEMATQNVGSFQHREQLRVGWDQYLSDRETVLSQGGLTIDGLFKGITTPAGPWSFLYLEHFERVLRAPNAESSDRVNRDINRLQLGLRYAPTGRSLAGLLHYENVVDYFEDDTQQFANRFQNFLGLTVGWRFRPVTVVFADVTGGISNGLGGSSVKVGSFPLTITTGIQTLLTLNMTLVGKIGYANGFYQSGPSYSTILGGAEFGYRYSPIGRFRIMYEYVHNDSIQANWYADHAITASLEQVFAPFVITAQGEVRFRHYEGMMTVVPTGPDIRDDVIFGVLAGARYNFREAWAAVLEYRFSAVQTEYVGMFGDDPSYTRHELVAGVRAAL